MKRLRLTLEVVYERFRSPSLVALLDPLGSFKNLLMEFSLECTVVGDSPCSNSSCN